MKKDGIWSMAMVGLVFAMAANPALAQGLTGATTDPAAAMQKVGAIAITVGGIAIVCVAIFQGVRCVAEHRHIGPAITGLIAGIIIAFGGSYWLTQLAT